MGFFDRFKTSSERPAGGTTADDALHLAACPRCGGVDIEVSAGSGAVLESITVDEPAGTSG